MTPPTAVDAIILARTGSSRLPRKVMLPVLGRPMLELTVERLLQSRYIGRLVVATSSQSGDDEIAELCSGLEVECYRGSHDDVLDRLYRCASYYEMSHVAQFGADNPLIDPAVCDRIIEVYLREEGKADYVTNDMPPTYNGQEVEVTSFEAIEAGWRETNANGQRPHRVLFSFIQANPGRFRVVNLTHERGHYHERWTLDYPEDYEFLCAVFKALYPANPAFGMSDIIDFLDLNPEVRQINALHARGWPGPTGSRTSP